VTPSVPSMQETGPVHLIIGLTMLVGNDFFSSSYCN
jgi:hypothetical protein